MKNPIFDLENGGSTYTRVNTVHSTERQTRYGSYLICPKYKRESEGARTFQVSATRFWNSLPNEIKCSSSFEILEKSLFKYFLESYEDVYHFTIAYFILMCFVLILR